MLLIFLFRNGCQYYLCKCVKEQMRERQRFTLPWLKVNCEEVALSLIRLKTEGMDLAPTRFFPGPLQHEADRRMTKEDWDPRK